MKVGKQFRAYGAKEIKLDKESRTIEFPFSSELPVERWFGKEILSHDPGAADLSRLNDGAALLWNHNSDVMIGVVESAEMRDKRGYVKVRFSQNEQAQSVMRDIEDGILRNVSFGYQIQEMTQLNPGVKNQDPEFLATKWMPYEVSFVSVPADPTVGVGRSETEEKIEVRVLNKEINEGDKMGEKDKIEVDAGKVAAEAKAAERARIAQIEKLGEKFKKPDLARQLIEGDKSIEDARAAFLEAIGVEQKPVTQREAEIGMSDKEKNQFSFLRLMNALANPNDRKAQEAAKFEREVSEAAAKRTGKAPQGFLVPVDVLRSARRDLVVGTASAGGDLVAEELLAGSFIELLRKKMAMSRLGARVLNGLVGNITIPRQTGAATAYWVAESASPTESAQAFDQVAMSPKTVGAFTDYSRKLLLQSSIDVESMVRADLAAVIALEIDRVSLYGSGSSNQPLGLKDTSGVNTVDFAGNAPTWGEIVDIESAIAADNADVSGMKYLINANGRGVLKKTVKESGQAIYILDQGLINGYQYEVSNQVSQVASSKEHYWFGNWADAMIGFWSGLDIMADPYTGSTSGTVRIVALQDCDVAFRHPESFCLGANLT